MAFCMSSATVCMLTTLSDVSSGKLRSLSVHESEMNRYGMLLDCLDGQPLSFMCFRGMSIFSEMSSFSLPTVSVSGKYSVNFSFRYSILNVSRRRLVVARILNNSIKIKK